MIQTFKQIQKIYCAYILNSDSFQQMSQQQSSQNLLNIIFLLRKNQNMNTNRSEIQRSNSRERKSLQRQQINLLLYKNGEFPINKSKESGLSKTITINRSKAKSSQGNYKDQIKKYSVELISPEKKISLTNWIENGNRGDLIKKKQKISKVNFNYHHVIGRGGFGKVWKVQQKKTGKIFAMKEMSKAVIITKKSVPSVINQKTLLVQLKNMFIVNMSYAFQDRQTLYLVMDLMPGGDLRYHICRRKKFNQDETRFFVACIFSGLEYLHSKNIIHRDIKPENLVIDSHGYIRITDLGIAKQYRVQNNSDTSGTPGYMAPEVMCRQNHSYSVDYYALGVIAYELMIGRRPYAGRSRKQIRDQILSKQTIIKKTQIPEGWSIQAADFINKLIQRKPILRLGWGGIDEIKKHPWLKNFPWQKLYKKQLTSPFIPDQKQDNFDGRHHVTIEDQQLREMIKQNTILLRKNTVQQLFDGYTYQDQHKISEVSTISCQNKKK